MGYRPIAGQTTCPGQAPVAAWCRVPGLPHPPHARPAPRPPGWTPWREHSTHGTDAEMTDVESLDGNWVLARLCVCGAQLPPSWTRDPDGWVVSWSWEPVVPAGGDRLTRVLRVLGDVRCLLCSRAGLHAHDRE